MKFGHYIATNEDIGVPEQPAVPESEAQELPEGQGEESPPAGLTEDNIQKDPNATEAEQAVEVENSLDKSQEEASEILDQPQTLGEYLQAGKQLDAVQKAAQEATADGGVLTKMDARAIQSSMESILKKLDIERKPLPTLESFSGKWTQGQASHQVMESIFDSGRKVVSKIIEGLKSLVEIVIKFLSNVMKNRKLLEMRIVRLQEKLSTRMGDDPKEKTIKGKFAHGLQFKNKADADTVYKQMQSADLLVDGFELGSNLIKDIRDNRVAKAMDQFYKLNGLFAKNGIVGKVSGVNENSSADLYLALPNGMSVCFPESEEFRAIVYHTNQDGAPNMTETESPIPSEIQLSLKMALNVIQSLRRVESKVNTISDSLKGIVRNLVKEYETLRAAMGSSDYAKKVELNKSAKVLQELTGKLIARFPALIFTSVKNVADWASAGINNLKSA